MTNQKREAQVWERVMAASAQAPCCKPAEENMLTPEQVMELLLGEQMAACTYGVLAARVKGETRRCLMELMHREKAHYRKLEAIYYLMTGRRPCPDQPKAPCVSCTNEELRRVYADEVAAAAKYHCLAAKAGSFAPQFHELGHEEETHAAKILSLLEYCL